MAYREVNLTGWLDPALKYFADQAGITIPDYSSQVGGEGIGNALEALADFFTKGWLNKGIQCGAGLIADMYAVWGKDVPIRLRKELLALGTHELLRIVDPKPSDIIEVRHSVELFTDAAVRGDWNAALSSVLRTPAELQTMLGVTGTPPATTLTAGGEGKKYVTKSPAPAPALMLPPPAPTLPPPTPSKKGRYQVTG